MKYLELQRLVVLPFFTYADTCKLFPLASSTEIKTQLSRFVAKGYTRRLMRGVYVFADRQYDEYCIARLIQPHSYISLETALSFYGMIPDVPQTITSIGGGTRKKSYSVSNVVYTFTPLKSSFHYGHITQGDRKKGYYTIACREKALLDYIYIRKIRSLAEMRIDVSQIDKDVYYRYRADYPLWIQKIQI